MSEQPDKPQENSILSEIYSLAPYFSYDESNGCSDASTRKTDAAPRQPHQGLQESMMLWENRRKEYVHGS